MLILLVGLDEHDGTRRRSILTTVKTIDSDGNTPPPRHPLHANIRSLTSRLAGLETSQASVTALSYNVPYPTVVAASLRVRHPLSNPVAAGHTLAYFEHFSAWRPYWSLFQGS